MRTSPLKFDHFRYPKPDFIASDLTTKFETYQNTRAYKRTPRRAFAVDEPASRPLFGRSQTSLRHTGPLGRSK